MQSSGVRFCGFASQVTGVVPQNLLAMICQRCAVQVLFFTQQQLVHVVVRLARSAAQATSPGVNARFSLSSLSKCQRHDYYAGAASSILPAVLAKQAHASCRC